MTKFQKIQRLSSVIPVLSTAFVTFITMFQLKKNKASWKLWIYFMLTLFTSGIIVFFVNNVLMSGEFPILNLIVTGLLFAITNMVLVEIQILASKERPTTESKHNNWQVWCVIALVIFGAIVALSFLFAPTVDISDENGEEVTSLATITRDEIAFSEDHYSEIGSRISYKGNSSQVSGTLEKYDYDEVEFRCKRISGVKTLQVSKTNEKQLTLEISSLLESGNLEIAIIVDDEICEIIPANTVKSVLLTDIMGKTVCVKVAAESARTEIYILRR